MVLIGGLLMITAVSVITVHCRGISFVKLCDDLTSTLGAFPTVVCFLDHVTHLRFC